MPRQTLAALAVAIVASVIGFGLWYSNKYPPQVLRTGTMRADVRGEKRVLNTRDVAINGAEFREVQMPRGTWIGCGGDCEKAVHDAGDGFWESRERQR